MFERAPVKKLSRQTTSSPLVIKRSHRCEPRKPAPPVTRTRRKSNPIAEVRRCPDLLANDPFIHRFQHFDPVFPAELLLRNLPRPHPQLPPQAGVPAECHERLGKGATLEFAGDSGRIGSKLFEIAKRVEDDRTSRCEVVSELVRPAPQVVVAALKRYRHEVANRQEARVIFVTNKAREMSQTHQLILADVAQKSASRMAEDKKFEWTTPPSRELNTL